MDRSMTRTSASGAVYSSRNATPVRMSSRGLIVAPAYGGSAPAGNGRDPPANRWSYWHVSEILPTSPVRRGDGPPRPLPDSAAAGRIDAGAGLLGIGLTRSDGQPGTVGAVLDDTFTDAYVVLQGGALVTEWYGPSGAADRPHALMSVTKSVLGCVAGALAGRGQLEPGREVTDYVPELRSSGYAGATVRD